MQNSIEGGNKTEVAPRGPEVAPEHLAEAHNADRETVKERAVEARNMIDKSKEYRVINNTQIYSSRGLRNMERTKTTGKGIIGVGQIGESLRIERRSVKMVNGVPYVRVYLLKNVEVGLGKVAIGEAPKEKKFAGVSGWLKLSDIVPTTNSRPKRAKMSMRAYEKMIQKRVKKAPETAVQQPVTGPTNLEPKPETEPVVEVPKGPDLEGMQKVPGVKMDQSVFRPPTEEKVEDENK